ncbi:hypothetical protein Hanom_Chr15g01354051 [Helianthus anomalus]
MSKLSFPCLTFGQFCDFQPKVCFSASGSWWFQNLVIFVPAGQSAKPQGKKWQAFKTMRTHMRKTKPLDESRRSGQTLGTKMTTYSKNIYKNIHDNFTFTSYRRV